MMKQYISIISAACLLLGTACSSAPHADSPSLKDDLLAIADTVPGTVGIAYISDTDTITVNNNIHYPMMSVYKLHQALAVAATLDRKGTTLDSLLTVSSDELDRNTWSPALNKYTSGDFHISVGELMASSVTMSDNNASNLMFEHILSPRATHDFIKSIVSDTTFQIRYSEAEMKVNPTLSYLNYSSPLSAGLLIRQVFEEALVDTEKQDSIRHYLSVVTTGQDRLGAAVHGSDIAVFAHKTGSGYRNAIGELMAHNDIGYFRLTDGRSYSLAVFVRDFRGSEAEASAVIADISRCVYEHMKSGTVR